MTVRTDRRDHVLVITLHRPEKRNALDHVITAGLDAALNELEDDPELWCGVLTGGPDFFCAGADLATGPGDPTPRGGIVGIINRRRTKPLVAAVEGFALGGGLELVFCCDLVVAATNARFGLPEVKRGLIPNFGGTFRVSRLLPANVARELLFLGTDLDAVRAERLGFVNLLTEPHGTLAAAVEMAERLCTNAPLAVWESLELVNDTIVGDEQELWKREDRASERLRASEDGQEGRNAFLEKRAPDFRGR